MASTVFIGGRDVHEESRISDAGPFASGLVESILAPDCPISAALSNEDKANLKKLAKESQAGETKQ
jgi:hypothetical protein